MRTFRFTIDLLDSKTFKAYTQDEDWNGFACPYFNYNQTQNLLDAWISAGRDAKYETETDQFTFEVDSGENAKDYDSFLAVEIDGLKFYPIGAFSWIWEEVREAERV